MLPFVPNGTKNLIISTEEGDFARYPVMTHVVKSGDDLEEMMETYLCKYLQEGDRIFISEKIVAISQGRAFPIDKIKPRRLAKFLCRFVYKTPYGIGLGSPWTMELAIRELGAPKILFAAFCSAVTKLFGIRGVFYRICGPRARAIDGPCDCTLPPYNHYAKLAPKKPDEVAARLAKKTGVPVVIIDANDLGVEVLGRSDKKELTVPWCRAVFKDNPLDQSRQQTPLCIVRPVTKEEGERLVAELSEAIAAGTVPEPNVKPEAAVDDYQSKSEE